ncbi:MAG: hypothetical protein ACTSWR_09385 [Candidatus Helarchaeota archaeon]
MTNAIFTLSDNLENANSYYWYKIIYNTGDLLQINVSSSDNRNYIIGAIISTAVQPSSNLGGTLILVADILNATHNVSLKYRNSNYFQHMTGLYLLIVALNNSNPENLSYIINSTHPLLPYSYEQFFQEVHLPLLLLIATIFIVVGAIVSVYFILKYKKSGKPKLI